MSPRLCAGCEPAISWVAAPPNRWLSSCLLAGDGAHRIAGSELAASRRVSACFANLRHSFCLLCSLLLSQLFVAYQTSSRHRKAVVMAPAKPANKRRKTGGRAAAVPAVPTAPLTNAPLAADGKPTRHEPFPADSKSYHNSSNSCNDEGKLREKACLG